MKIVFLPISLLSLLFVISVGSCGQNDDSDRAMSAQEKADFLNTMFPLAKKDGINMDVIDVSPQSHDFVASFKDGQKALEEVIAHPDTATAVQLFTATDMTFRAGRLQEAAFLYHAGSLRLYYDLEKYPPRESDSGDTMRFLNVLKNNVRIGLVRNLYMQPKIFAEVFRQLEAWEIKEQDGYNPGWEYTPKDVPADRFATIKTEVLDILKPTVELLNIPEYSEAVKLLRECNELPFDQQEDKTVMERRSKAEDTLRRIEKEKNLRGIMYQTENQPSE